jgi:peptide/nickel transport system substrate-binding protein
MLDSAGFKKGADGIRVDPTTHQEMSYSLMVPTGFIDWVAVTKLIKAQLLAIGIQINLTGGSSQQWTSNNVNGSFDMTMNVASGGPTPYQMYEPILRSKYTAAVGKPAASNYVRWSDPSTDKLFDQYDNSDDPAVQKKAIEGIETIMVDQLPVIPLLGSADWYQYRTANYVGWPSESNAYAMGMPSRFPDNLLVLNHLTPAK